MKKFDLKVEKIGRKWLVCKDQYNRIFKVEINEIVKELLSKQSDEITVCGDLEDKSNKYGVNRMIINVIPELDYEKIQENEQKEKEQYLLNQKINRLEERIYKMLYCIDKNIEKYWYKNGEKVVLETIEELKSNNANVTKFEKELLDLKNKYEDLQKQKSLRIAEINKFKFTDKNYYAINSIVCYNGKYVKIVSRKSKILSRDDVEAMYGGCFADNNEDYYQYRQAYEYTFESANQNEIDETKKVEEEKELEKKEQQLKKEQVNNLKEELLNYIYENSTTEEKSVTLEDNIEKAEYVCEVGRNTIKKLNNNLYLLIPNWSDWDNWDYNNCNIGICKTCILTDELLSLIDKYVATKEALSC